jgi:hypothetical protein
VSGAVREAIRKRAKPRSEVPEPIADGDCTNPFRTRVLKALLAWEIGDEDPPKKLPKVATWCHRRRDPQWRVFRPVSDLSPKSFLAWEIGAEDPFELWPGSDSVFRG